MEDFFIHIATIVVGLLIAVGLEQTVEAIHHHRELQKAREELHDEVESNRRAIAKQLEFVHQMQAELKADMTVCSRNVPGTGRRGRLSASIGSFAERVLLRGRPINSRVL